MTRIYNFSSGPATLPDEVLAQVQAELLDWNGSGMSVMEMSHRGKHFTGIAQACEADLRAVLGVPDDYHVLFLQGGATAQFGVVPQNLLGGRRGADFLVNGFWGKKAAAEFGRFGRARVVASSEAGNFTAVPALQGWQPTPDTAYLHLTGNETIHGVELFDLPDAQGLPIVADLSSNIASRPMDVSRYGLIYAGAQKNLGPSGITLVIVRRDLCQDVLPGTLSINDYRSMAANQSMLNTPPTFAWYTVGLVFKWIRAQGGVEVMAQRNAAKAALLYDYLDSQDFYRNPVQPAFRSRMNVPFTLADSGLDNGLERDFLAGAQAAGLDGLKGHRLVGGMRASIYNAMPEAGVRALISYMKDFVARRG